MKLGSTHLKCALVAGFLLLPLLGFSQMLPSSESEAWNAAGDMRMASNRAEVVKKLFQLETTRKTNAVERGRRLGLKIREERPDHRVRELIDWQDDKPLFYSTMNANAAISTGSDKLRVAPYNANGLGWTIGIWDGGAVLSTHQEFGGRVTVMDGASPATHSTHVGGTIGATGVAASAIGMARAVLIDSYEWNNDGSEMTSDAPDWSASANIGTSYWTLTNSRSHTPPNSYFAPGPESKNTDNLLSEAFTIPATYRNLQLHFWHQYDMEIYDGGLLEVSPNNGTSWYEIGQAGSGASFIQGGYPGVIQSPKGSPENKAELVGKPAWNGNNGGTFSEVIVALSEFVYTGTTLRVRWRLSTDASTASTGWYVDTVRLTGYDTALKSTSGTLIIIK